MLEKSLLLQQCCHLATRSVIAEKTFIVLCLEHADTILNNI